MKHVTRREMKQLRSALIRALKYTIKYIEHIEKHLDKRLKVLERKR